MTKRNPFSAARAAILRRLRRGRTADAATIARDYEIWRYHFAPYTDAYETPPTPTRFQFIIQQHDIIWRQWDAERREWVPLEEIDDE